MRAFKHYAQQGFTLVEMMVIAPIVVLMIGAFIALIVNLTGEVMSSRGSNVLAYDVQDALNRIEEDVKLSTTFLAVNNINVTDTKQGYGGTTTTGSTTPFTNVAKTGGSSTSLILNSLATNANPLSDTANLVYLANKQNSCDAFAEYSKNTPMSTNIVYFVQNDTLWRRVIMPKNYADSTIRCGTAPWQLPSCINGYNKTNLSFCKTNDMRLIDGVTASDFTVDYFTAANTNSPDTTAGNPGVTNDSIRNAALQATPTAAISITAKKTIAGRDLAHTGTVRVTRLDTNASSIAIEEVPTAVPATPAISATVSDGHNVNFTWRRVPGATSYDLRYRINGGAWQTQDDIDNSNRSYTVSDGWHKDKVEAEVRATNSKGDSAWSSRSIDIPLWAPLILKGGWTDYAQGYTTAGYTKTKSGLVLLKGLVRHSGSPPIGDFIAELPADYKPAGRLLFGTSTSPNASARVDINPSAESAQVIFNDAGNPAWFSLDTVRYVAADAPGRTNVSSLPNGFTPYGGTYEGPSYTQDPITGRVTFQGLLSGGTRTNGYGVIPIPAALRPAKYQHHPSRSGSFHHLGIDKDYGLLAKGDGTGAYSINATYLPASQTGWAALPLINGWTYYNDSGGMFSTPEYTKTSDGIVQLKGLIRSGTNSQGSVLATLPAGFRPATRILSTTVNTGGYARIDVTAAGQVVFQGTSNTWYALDGVTFMAEQ